MKFSVVITGFVSFAAFALAVPTLNDISPISPRPEVLRQPAPPVSQSVKAGVSTGMAIKSMDPHANQMCVDNRDAKTVDGNPIQLHLCTYSRGGQLWRFNDDSTIELLFTPKTTTAKYCLDYIEKTGEYYKVVLNKCSAALLSQQWYLSDTNNIVNKKLGFCLDIRQQIYKKGTELIVYQCEDNGKKENQLWALSDL